jgi:hypothetical protein
MKIQENEKPKTVPFRDIERGGVFRYQDDIIMKIDIFKCSIGTLKAIRLRDGAGYACAFGAFDNENTLVEPLDATLVIN